jgi:hypothetical protein
MTHVVTTCAIDRLDRGVDIPAATWQVAGASPDGVRTVLVAFICPLCGQVEAQSITISRGEKLFGTCPQVAGKFFIRPPTAS